MNTRYIFPIIILGTSLALAGCGKKSASDNTGDPAPSRTENAGGATEQSSGAPTAASGRKIEITGNDSMKFSLTEIRAKPGESLSVTLNNTGTVPKFSMGHNWVLLKSMDSVESFVGQAQEAATTDYIPADRKADILAYTRLLGPKETDTVTFQAPATPGQYPFLCSFPGHYQVGMKGVLIVE